MFHKILVANRGEIAVRIIRACRTMGIQTVAIHSVADAESLHVQLADESLCIGPASPLESYLNPFSVLSAAQLSGAEAIHPGYGFLSENARFARMCAKCGVTFIGPSAECIERMGDKLQARRTMIEAGVRVIPGSEGVLEGPEHALRVAEEVGYPVMIKAAAGGGGRGIRRVESPEELTPAYESAQAEAQAAFGDGRLYMERCIENAYHIEVQILADGHGRAVHLCERNCSMQRRNQKVLEEAPCSHISPELRREMGEMAVRAALAAGYSNAGTVEFLLDKAGNYYFMEMNTRIQVEHPVTEMITGVDLIEQQICIAAGEPFTLTQDAIHPSGHAIECRINAEDPAHGFRPCCGTIQSLHVPGGPGVRFDSMLYQGTVISPHYDSMLGKLIVHAPTREHAIRRMNMALMELVVEGVTTNMDFMLELINEPGFLAGDYDVSYIANRG